MKSRKVIDLKLFSNNFGSLVDDGIHIKKIPVSMCAIAALHAFDELEYIGESLDSRNFFEPFVGIRAGGYLT